MAVSDGFSGGGDATSSRMVEARAGLSDAGQLFQKQPNYSKEKTLGGRVKRGIYNWVIRISYPRGVSSTYHRR